MIPSDRKARANRQLAGSLYLAAFAEGLCTAVGCTGRAARDPRLLESVRVCAGRGGTSSARAIEAFPPALAAGGQLVPPTDRTAPV